MLKVLAELMVGAVAALWSWCVPLRSAVDVLKRGELVTDRTTPDSLVKFLMK